MEKEALEKAKAWATNPFFDDESRKEVQKLIDNNDTKEIVDRFYKEMSFGTGGIRGVIGEGSNRLNKYAVMRATHALALAVKAANSGDLKVAVSYDSRRFSPEFAKVTAQVLAANGIHAYLYERLNPVCLLSWSVRHHKAQAGVMITASHNPPEYNGYKVYWDDGCQITEPHDQIIIDHYYSLTDLSIIPQMSFEEGLEKGLIHMVGEDIENAYNEKVATYSINPKLCKEKGAGFPFVFTPIHGSGLVPVKKILDTLGLTNYKVVKEQAAPDGDFPTVTSPNPENPQALALAVDLMKKTSSRIALGTDPDADRIGCAVMHKDEVHYLNGNQIGSLLLNYICANKKEQGSMPSSPYCIKTIVTTDLQCSISDHYGVEIISTLTGFKWIGREIKERQLNHPEKTFLFGSEESFGYLNHDNVRDKDGVAPVALMVEMALWYDERGMTLIDGLNELFEKFGFAHESLLNLSYKGADGAAKIIRIMDHFRTFNQDNICDEKIIARADFEAREERCLVSGKTTSTNLPASNVLNFTFDSDTKLVLRPSGTEPKIKFYLLIRANSGSLNESKKLAKEKEQQFMEFLSNEAKKC